MPWFGLPKRRRASPRVIGSAGIARLPRSTPLALRGLRRRNGTSGGRLRRLSKDHPLPTSRHRGVPGAPDLSIYRRDGMTQQIAKASVPRVESQRDLPRLPWPRQAGPLPRHCVHGSVSRSQTRSSSTAMAIGTLRCRWRNCWWSVYTHEHTISPSIDGLSAVFGIDRAATHFSVPLQAMHNLQTMCRRLEGGLLGMYSGEHGTGLQFGRRAVRPRRRARSDPPDAVGPHDGELPVRLLGISQRSACRSLADRLAVRSCLSLAAWWSCAAGRGLHLARHQRLCQLRRPIHQRADQPATVPGTAQLANDRSPPSSLARSIDDGSAVLTSTRKWRAITATPLMHLVALVAGSAVAADTWAAFKHCQ